MPIEEFSDDEDNIGPIKAQSGSILLMETVEPRRESKEYISPREEFLRSFEYLKLPKEEYSKLLLMKETELLNNLNMHINNYNPDAHEPDVMYFAYRDSSLISFSAQSEKGVGSKLILRNMTGRFAWNFIFLHSVHPDCIKPGAKGFEKIVKQKLKVKTLDPFEENKPENKKAEEQQLLKKKSLSEEEARKDIFKELADKIKELIPDLKEWTVLDGTLKVKKTMRVNVEIFEERYEKAKEFEEKRFKTNLNNLSSEVIRYSLLLHKLRFQGSKIL